MKKLFLFLLSLSVALLSSCNNSDPDPDPTPDPETFGITLSVSEVGDDSALVSLNMTNATAMYYNYKMADGSEFTAEELLTANELTENSEFTISPLAPLTSYIVCAIAVDADNNLTSEVVTETFTTTEKVIDGAPTASVEVSDITSSTCLIGFLMDNATAMYVTYRVYNDTEVTAEELLASGKAYETVYEYVSGMYHSTEYVAAAIAVNENTGEVSEIASITFTTEEPAGEEEIQWNGEFYDGIFQYMGTHKMDNNIGLYKINLTTNGFTYDSNFWIYPSTDEEIGLAMNLYIYADVPTGNVATPPVGTYTLGEGANKFTFESNYTTSYLSYVTTLYYGTPAFYSITEGTLTITDNGNGTYTYDISFIIKNEDEGFEDAPLEEVTYTYTCSDNYADNYNNLK